MPKQHYSKSKYMDLIIKSYRIFFFFRQFILFVNFNTNKSQLLYNIVFLVLNLY